MANMQANKFIRIMASLIARWSTCRNRRRNAMNSAFDMHAANRAIFCQGKSCLAIPYTTTKLANAQQTSIARS